MFPIAGVIVWLIVGGVVGLMTSKITRTDGPNGLMANIGVGWVTAVIAGSMVAFFSNGNQTGAGFWASIAVAAGAAVVGTALFRLVFPTRAATLR